MTVQGRGRKDRGILLPEGETTSRCTPVDRGSGGTNSPPSGTRERTGRHAPWCQKQAGPPDLYLDREREPVAQCCEVMHHVSGARSEASDVDCRRAELLCRHTAPV